MTAHQKVRKWLLISAMIVPAVLMSALPARGDIVYTLTDPFGTKLVFDSPGFITSITDLLGAGLVSCTSYTSNPCSSAEAAPHVAGNITPMVDAIDRVSPSPYQHTATGAQYFFPLGAFGAVGTYQTVDEGLFNTGTGTLTVVDTSITAAVPEPSSLLLLGSGLAGFAGMLRRKLIH